MSSAHISSTFIMKLNLSAALLLTCIFSPSLAAIQVINVAPRILAAAEAPPERRAEVLAKSLTPLSDLYLELVGITDINAVSQQYTGLLEKQQAGLMHLADVTSIEAELNLYVTTFRDRFPRFDDADLSIYVLPSFGRFQAQSRMFHGKPALLLDTAFFASMGTGSIPRPFVHHELFHLYHYQLRQDVSQGAEAFFRTGQPPSLGTLLWVEGLAVHAARTLSPEAPDSQLFPSPDIVPATEAQYSHLLQSVADNTQQATMAAICQFFYFPCADKHNPIPLNSGYVVGERLVKRMLGSRSLEGVMLLKDSELSAAVRQAAKEEQTALRPAAAH
jgi:hypothetical protein